MGFPRFQESDIKCGMCGEHHEIFALTPFPMEAGWPCPYDGSAEALRKRIEKIVESMPGMESPEAYLAMMEGSDE